MSQTFDVRESTVSEQHDRTFSAQAGMRDVLCLFGSPSVLHAGHRVAVPEGAQRLVVLVALRGGRVDRRSLAGNLWPDGSDDRAAGNLRSAIWRLRGAGLDLLTADHRTLTLREGVEVDVRTVAAWADRVVRGAHLEADLSLEGRHLDPEDLLPGWYDEWVIVERERIRQRILHGLEALSLRLRDLGRTGEAVEAALRAVQLEPLRESAQRLLILAHLEEGNRVEATRTLRGYKVLLRRELGVRPDPGLDGLLTAPPPRRLRSP